MMSKKTASVIASMNEYKNEVKTRKEWAILLNDKITFDTFKKYALEEVVVKTKANLKDVVELLNSCAGADCYDCEWFYEVIDNEVYQIETCYKMV